MKNKKIGLVLLFSFALALTGCSKEENVADVSVVEEKDETGFGITLEEQQMCAEYVAGVLMKYNAGSNMRVLEGKNLEIKEAQEQVKKEQEEKRQQLADEYAASQKEEAKSKKESGNNSSGSSSAAALGTISYINDMSAATGTEAFSIQYDSFEVTKSYAENDDFFSVDAVQGKVLVVTKFAVTNISSQTESFQMYSLGGKYKLHLNGESYKAQQTLLLNDLSMYKGDINAGETIQTVLVFEVPEDKAANVNSMELDITVNDEISTMLLQGVGENVMLPEAEASDLAAEYEAALQSEEAVIEEIDADIDVDTESAGGNVTVVGSNNSISHE